MSRDATKKPRVYGLREHDPDPYGALVYGCYSGKIGYGSKATAKRAMKAGRRAGGSHRSVYLCRCGAWHTTSQRA